MSRENSYDDLNTLTSTTHKASLSSSLPASQFQMDANVAGPSRVPNRRASKSVSRPPGVSTPRRTASFYAPSTPTLTVQTPTGATLSPRARPEGGLKRRISTPMMSNLILDEQPEEQGTKDNGSLQQSASRARSTSTSIVVPSTLTQAEPTIAVPLSKKTSRPAGLIIVPPPEPIPQPGLLTNIYNMGESSLTRITGMVPVQHLPRRGSEDSEKGLDLLEEESSSTGTRGSTEEKPRGKFHGAWTGEDDGYFSLPPTPTEGELDEKQLAFGEALARAGKGFASLPTPALSRHSLSAPARTWGWWSNLITRVQWDAKTGAVVRELGWTVAVLVIGFCVTLGMVVGFLGGLPITTLKHIPKSTTDVQLLSAEIKDYMQASSFGWYHTVGVITFVGCWKHAWSVPGAVVLNILVGTLLQPLPALGLLTIITATGSLGSYCLSRPLAPLIAVLFPKPLALVRAALAPDSTPTLNVVPVESPATNTKPIWRRLLIMRAMGIVPWSGMNVACGVVGVDWRVFWLTTAAGSASWSYVTASVGDILSRLAIPKEGENMEGESIASLLRDPVLIAKLVFLTGLTLIPVMLKKGKSQTEAAEKDAFLQADDTPTSPNSPLASSVSRFTPTPAAFDLLSSGRTLGRTMGRWRWVGGVSRLAGGVWARVMGQVQ